MQPPAPRVACGIVLLSMLVFPLPTRGEEQQGLRVLPPGQVPHDSRLGPLKTLDGYFPFTPPSDLRTWEARAERVRRQILVSLGLWPMPTSTPLNAVVHGRIDRGTYTVEKVYFESYPGHFVTGNLYRPRVGAGPRPAVLCPHGHWNQGRFYDLGDRGIREAIVNGEERFLAGGRSPLQSRCVQLARMGCVVFHYDMVGYADSVQIAHRPDVRPHMNTPENWGFFSPQAELRFQNMMGLQTYNSIRALDFLESLPDVDPTRIGVTGASGGGTQTFILCAVDPRPAVAFPAVMVSTAMQGGCTCENACGLRVGAGNIEFAGLFAPKPLGMTAANDWTVEITTKGLPELRRLYALFGQEANVMARPLTHFGHNYNYVSRAVMYSWFNKHLGLGFEDPILEDDFIPLTPAEMTVWDEHHPPPPRGDEYERGLLRWMTRDAQRQLASLQPRDPASLAEFRRVVAGALDVMIGRPLPEKYAVACSMMDQADRGDFTLFKGLLENRSEGEQIPVVCLQPKPWNNEVVIWVDGEGKQALCDGHGNPREEVRELLAAGYAVAGLDMLYQGEFLADGEVLTETRQVGRSERYPNPYAGYTFGYNHSVFAQRVHDVLSAIAYTRDSDKGVRRIHLFGVHGAGPIAAAAAVQAGSAVDRLAIDTEGFRFAKINRTTDPNFLPGGARYGDLPGIVALLAGRDVALAGEGESPPELISMAFAAAGGDGKLTLVTGPEMAAARFARWLAH